MSLTQIAQIFSIIGVTIALIKLGIDVKKDKNGHTKSVKVNLENINIELKKIKKDIQEQKQINEHLELTISKLKERR